MGFRNLFVVVLVIAALAVLAVVLLSRRKKTGGAKAMSDAELAAFLTSGLAAFGFEKGAQAILEGAMRGNRAATEALLSFMANNPNATPQEIEEKAAALLTTR